MLEAERIGKNSEADENIIDDDDDFLSEDNEAAAVSAAVSPNIWRDLEAPTTQTSAPTLPVPPTFRSVEGHKHSGQSPPMLRFRHKGRKSRGFLSFLFVIIALSIFIKLTSNYKIFCKATKKLTIKFSVSERRNILVFFGIRFTIGIERL